MLPAGAETRRVMSRSHAGPRRRPPTTARPPRTEENRDLADSEEKSGKKERTGGGGGEEEEEEVEVKEEMGEVGRKVCEHFGWECSQLQDPSHVRIHKPWMNCSLRSFTTKASDRFKAHEEAHKKGKLSIRCDLCRDRHSSEASLKVHYRRTHGLIRFRDCPDGFSSEDEVHDNLAVKRKWSSPGGSKRSEYVCQLCMKESRTKFQLKIHIANHLGVRSSDISDEFLEAPRGFWKEDQSVLPAFVDVERESNRQSEGGPDASGVRTYDLFPEPLFEIPFVSVREESSVNLCVPRSPEGKESVICDDPGMSKTQPSVSGKGSLGHQENPLQNWTRGCLACILCAEKFPNIEELILHCKNAHKKKLEETSNRISESQRQHAPVEPSSSKRKSIGPWETFKNTRSLQKCTSLNPRVVLEKILDPELLKQLGPLSNEPITTVSKREVKVCQVGVKKVKAEIPCSECHESFSSRKAFNKHKDRHRKEESKKSFVCPECGRAVFSRVRLFRHLRVGHRDKLRCRYRCLLLFGSTEEVSEHYRKFHEMATSSACMYCGSECQETGCLQNHLKSCPKRPREKPSYICKVCGEVFKISRDYKFHVKKCTTSNDSENIDANTSNGTSLDQKGLPSVCSPDPLAQETSATSCKFSSLKSEPISGEQLDPLSDHLANPPEEGPVTAVGKGEPKVCKVRVKKTKPEIPCSKCHKVFCSRKSFIRHRDRHRRRELKTSFNCPECGKFCISRVSLYRHLKRYHKDKLRCRYMCPFVFGSRKEVSEHYVKFHELAASSACLYCGLEFQYVSRLRNHIERCKKCPPQERPSYTCESCRDVFRFSRDYRLHLAKCTLSNDSENVHANTSNGTSSPDRRGLKSEVCSVDPLPQETPGTSLQAPDQDPDSRKFSSPNSDPISGEHVRVKKIIMAEIPCSKCHKVFPSLRAFNRHQDTHQREEAKKSLGCPECGKFCGKRSKLLKHFRLSHGDKLRCRYRCPLVFGTVEEVSEHYRKFHEVGTSSACLYCGLEYQDTGTLQNHLKICEKRPRGKPSYTCEICGDTFDFSRDYKFHVKKCTLSNE